MSAAPADGAAAGAAFPWDEAMAAGLGLLRLSPRDFWTMTPREFCAALSPFAARIGGPPDLQALGDLMRRFPDPPRSP